MKAKLLLVLVLISAGLFAEQAPSNEPQYTKEGELVKPENYREWIYLSSGMGMTYGSPIANPDDQDFDNVFVTPQAYKSFLATGTWPDKTMMALEVRFSASKGSINKGGRFQDKLAGVEIHLKDEKRFLSTIARRLDTLGAITRGQRQTDGQGLFRADDNLESAYAKASQPA